MILDDSSDSKIIFREILCSLNTEVGRIKVHSVNMDIPISFRDAQMIVFKNTRVRDKKSLVKVGNLVKNSYLYR